MGPAKVGGDDVAVMHEIFQPVSLSLCMAEWIVSIGDTYDARAIGVVALVQTVGCQ